MIFTNGYVYTHHFLDSSVVPIVDVQQTTDRPQRQDYSKLWVSARCSFQRAALSYGFVLCLGFANVAGAGGVAGKDRVETVADVRFVLDATAAFFHRLYLFGTLALLEAAVLEACLDGARFELAQVTSAERHQSQKRSPIPSPTLVGPQLRTQSLPFDSSTSLVGFVLIDMTMKSAARGSVKRMTSLRSLSC